MAKRKFLLPGSAVAVDTESDRLSVAAADTSPRRPFEYCNVMLFTLTKHATGDQKRNRMMVTAITLLLNSDNSISSD